MNFEEFKTFFPKRLKDLREEKGIKAQTLSREIGMSRAYVRSLEDEGAMPSLKALFEIFDSLDLEPVEFFDKENRHPNAFKKILAIVNSLDGKRLDLFVAMGELLAELEERKQ